jgi:segregation and condensation protein A
MDSDIYQIHTDFFEGPFDLLLHLINKKKMNIHDIRISEITGEYLSYLENNRGINPSREGDFLMTASTLIYIKSRSLLPRSDLPSEEESLEQKLMNTLIEYDKIQKISKLLKEMETHSLLLWKREEITENYVNREYSLEEVSSFQLAELFLNIVKKKDQQDFMVLQSKNYSIDRKKKEILDLLDQQGFLDFFDYVSTLDTLEEIVVSFFTLLELIKRHLVVAVQKNLFDAISVWRMNPEEVLQ